jgi:low affinity Fe/Cu permease
MTDGFRRFATRVADHVGTPGAFFAALAVIFVWAVSGPLFRFSDTWQLAINTGTTIVTFLMVFVIQTTQNRDARALHLKLDELIRAQKAARNIFADLEDATEDEIKVFQEEFKALREKGLHSHEAASMAARKISSKDRHERKHS